ncbi:hypothetical protein [Bacillus sp. V3-13]|nr:hypothetical protein [Bacillus sp. V3-13]
MGILGISPLLVSVLTDKSLEETPQQPVHSDLLGKYVKISGRVRLLI